MAFGAIDDCIAFFHEGQPIPMIRLAIMMGTPKDGLITALHAFSIRSALTFQGKSGTLRYAITT
jgi:hypothetical protein